MSAPFEPLAEPFQIKVINNVLYMVARGRAAVPFIPDVPASERARVLEHMLTTNTSGGGPPVGGVDRSTLPAIYGDYKPVVVPADYTKSLCGARNRMADLTEWNSPNTLNFDWASVPGGTSPITIQDKIVYGRFRNAPRPIFAENCIFRGPKGYADSDSAVLDFHNPTTRTQSTFLDCTVAPQDPQPSLNAFKGSWHKVERCHTVWVVDGDGAYSWTSGYNTNVNWVGNVTEAHPFYPARKYGNHSPAYWDNTAQTWTSGGTYPRQAADGGPGFFANDKYYDSGHDDGTHTDGIEIHGARGSHTYNAATNRWTGDGIHIWGSAFNTRDGYDLTSDPTGLGIPMPTRGNPGTYQWGTMGWGDNPKRGLAPGGQKPGMVRPTPINQGSRRMNDGRFAADGSCVLFLQLVNQFPSVTSALMHDCWCDGANIGVQEQIKGFPTIQFTMYDVKFGPSWFPFGSLTWGGLNQAPIRLYDQDNITDTTRCVINGRPAGHPKGPAPWYTTMTWDDPSDLYNGQDGRPLPTTGVQGIRYH